MYHITTFHDRFKSVKHSAKRTYLLLQISQKPNQNSFLNCLHSVLNSNLKVNVKLCDNTSPSQYWFKDICISFFNFFVFCIGMRFHFPAFFWFCSSRFIAWFSSLVLRPFYYILQLFLEIELFNGTKLMIAIGPLAKQSEKTNLYTKRNCARFR